MSKELQPIEYKVLEGDPIIPVYHWQTGTQIYPSRKEYYAVEAFVQTWSFAKVKEIVKKETGYDSDSHQYPKNLLENQVCQTYLKQKLDEKGYFNGWTKERWVAMMTEHLTGKKRLAGGDLYAMKIVADVLGYSVPTQVNTAVRIDFVQNDGNA